MELDNNLYKNEINAYFKDISIIDLILYFVDNHFHLLYDN